MDLIAKIFYELDNFNLNVTDKKQYNLAVKEYESGFTDKVYVSPENSQELAGKENLKQYYIKATGLLYLITLPTGKIDAKNTFKVFIHIITYQDGYKVDYVELYDRNGLHQELTDVLNKQINFLLFHDL